MSALKKVSHSMYGGARPKFSKTIPMSNFDLLDWSKYLKIPLKNVLSRDEKVPHNHKLGLFVYNLEPAYMSGSHWVATYVRDNVINYFDSFGMARSFSRDGKSCKEKKLNSFASKPANTKSLHYNMWLFLPLFSQ